MAQTIDKKTKTSVSSKKEQATKKTVKKQETTKKTKKTVKKQETTKKEKKHFAKDVKEELKKVRWPLKKEMITYSIATLIIILIFGLFFVLTDLIIAGIRMLFI